MKCSPPEHKDEHTLTTRESGTFQIFRNWMYRGEVVDEEEILTATAIVELYVFTRHYVIPQLRDRVLEFYLLRFLKEGTTSQECTHLIYGLTSAQSTLRKLHIHMLVDTCKLDKLFCASGRHAIPESSWLTLSNTAIPSTSSQVARQASRCLVVKPRVGQ